MGGGGVVSNYRITIDICENYRNTVIKYLYKYPHRSIFNQILYFTVTGKWLKYRILTIFDSNYRNTVQKIDKYRIPSYRTRPMYVKQLIQTLGSRMEGRKEGSYGYMDIKWWVENTYRENGWYGYELILKWYFCLSVTFVFIFLSLGNETTHIFLKSLKSF